MFYGTDYDFGMIHWKITIQKMRGKMMIIYRTSEYSIFREMWIAENTWISVSCSWSPAVHKVWKVGQCANSVGDGSKRQSQYGKP